MEYFQGSSNSKDTNKESASTYSSQRNFAEADIKGWHVKVPWPVPAGNIFLVRGGIRTRGERRVAGTIQFPWILEPVYT